MITAIAAAFGGVSGGGGESGKIFSGVNTAIGGFGVGGNQGDGAPAAYLNYILFDQGYKVMDMGWTRVPTSAYFTKQQISISQVSVREAGYIFVYLSYEDQSDNWVEFDDLTITHTKSNVVQYNEYYPFGMQAQRSWTRDNSKNNYLYNGGSEMNTTSGWYETFYRGYDATLGRFQQVDPKATLTVDMTPYHFAGNNPVMFNDPNGDRLENWYLNALINGTLDLRSTSLSGGGGFDLGVMKASLWAVDAAFSSGDEGAKPWQMEEDAAAVNNKSMSLEEYAAKYGGTATFTTVDYYANGIQDAEHYIDTEVTIDVASGIGGPETKFEILHSYLDNDKSWEWFKETTIYRTNDGYKKVENAMIIQYNTKGRMAGIISGQKTTVYHEYVPSDEVRTEISYGPLDMSKKMYDGMWASIYVHLAGDSTPEKSCLKCM